MDGKKLTEIRNNLSMLPGLKDRLKKLDNRIYDAEQDVKELLSKLNAESYDVDKLKNDSLSVTLLKFIRQYEGKLDKEMKEALAAKINYDKAVNFVNELNSEREDILNRISKFENDKVLYEEELEKREKLLRDNINDEDSIKYKHLEAEREQLAQQLMETKEANIAASKVKNTADAAMDHLNSAEDWATYDVWTNGGIFSHIAKYDHIDDAQLEFNRLASQLKELQKELSDVNLFDNLEISEIDDTTKIIDFWFDNIFTDLNVRDQIRNNIEQLISLCSQVNSIIKKLENNKYEINKKLDDIENKKIHLLDGINVPILNPED